MIKSILKPSHGEVLLVADVAIRFLRGTSQSLTISSRIFLNVLADLAIEFIVV